MQLISTKDNNYTVKIDNIFLHSKYSPIKECKKFLNEKIKSNGTIVVLGAGLGYIYRILKEEFPDREIISIPYSTELQKQASILNPTDRIEYNCDENINNFLSRVLNERNINGLEILEWTPTARIYEEVSIKINQAIVQRVRQINGNILTTARFGKRWLKNSIKNYLEVENYVTEIKIEKPVIIAASGKSLSNSLGLIKEKRESIFLIALSSATTALQYHNVQPDLIFSTDPGYYSKLHLYNKKGIIAMPLSNSTAVKNPVLLINQGNHFEKEIINSANLPYIELGENGTVAGTALMFALKYSSSNIYLAGQDLESSDIQSHVKPYTFDNLLEKSSSRTSPYYSTMYRRWLDQGVTYKTYRDWFQKTCQKYPNRIYRIESESQTIIGVMDIKLSEFNINNSDFNKQKSTITISQSQKREDRIEIALSILKKWEKSINNISNEENYLLDLISSASNTDINNKAISIQRKDESKKFIKRLISLYGRQLL